MARGGQRNSHIYVHIIPTVRRRSPFDEDNEYGSYQKSLSNTRDETMRSTQILKMFLFNNVFITRSQVGGVPGACQVEGSVRTPSAVWVLQGTATVTGPGQGTVNAGMVGLTPPGCQMEVAGVAIVARNLSLPQKCLKQAMKAQNTWTDAVELKVRKMPLKLLARVTDRGALASASTDPGALAQGDVSSSAAGQGSGTKKKHIFQMFKIP